MLYRRFLAVAIVSIIYCVILENLNSAEILKHSRKTSQQIWRTRSSIIHLAANAHLMCTWIKSIKMFLFRWLWKKVLLVDYGSCSFA